MMSNLQFCDFAISSTVTEVMLCSLADILCVQLADSVGPYICMLKTHADIVKDFTAQTAQDLRTLATKYNFVIMEDRLVHHRKDAVHTESMVLLSDIHHLLKE